MPPTSQPKKKPRKNMLKDSLIETITDYNPQKNWSKQKYGERFVNGNRNKMH